MQQDTTSTLIDSTSALSDLNLEAFISQEFLTTLLQLAVIFVIGIPLLFILRRWARSFFTKKYASHYGMLAGKVVFYTGIVIMIVMVMGQLGFSLAPLLGAAGILGVALGFASQTSVSNIISGLFLIAEQPFKVDDIIMINQTTGTVLSIDMLSVKLRTFDNRFVRIPNEMIIKQEVTNLTKFPIRRFNATISVAYKEDISQVRDILLDVAENNEYCLSEPKPQVIFDMFGQSSIDLLLLVWAPKDEFILLKNSINEEVKARFDEENIEIPFPHVSIYSGEASKSIPIELIGGKLDEFKPEDEEEGKK
ncbi:mechanosensitive ion channel family protein [Gracilimonas tropica]|uniref:mechanosensitive ion channel family protein n=1 Tax=Gracilimonas tropica TaxID=454600 RepID=UPI000381EA58|nr:mechanosensitive ion channel family protein [Gracilimonas tropica]